MDEDAPGWRILTETTPDGPQERGRLMTLTQGQTLHVVRVEGVGMTAWVEGSAAKAVNGGGNWPGADLPDAVDVGYAWLREAADAVEFTALPRVNRLDVVRDFTGFNEGTAQAVLGGLGAVPSGGKRTKATYRDPTERHALTVMVRTKSAGAGRLYDKDAESGGVARGVVRFEAQERRRSLRKRGVDALEDLGKQVELVDSLGRARFAWCGFDRILSPLPDIVRAIMEDDTVGSGRKMALIGYAHMVAAGMAPKVGHRSTDWRLRTDLAAYGSPASGDWRLDYDEGLIAA